MTGKNASDEVTIDTISLLNGNIVEQVSLPIDILNGIVQHPCDHERYFEPFTLTLPVRNLIASRLRHDGIKNASSLMKNAYTGTGGRRKPIQVKPHKDQKFLVVDGNSTLANAWYARWPDIPVEILETD